MRYLIFLLSLLPAWVNATPSAADVFVMETTACFGTCPAYKVSVFSDGVIIFSGEAYTKREGTYRLPDNQALFQSILRLLDENGFQKYQDDYGWTGEDEESSCKEQWTDHPSTVLSLQFASKIKTVHHYHGCEGFEREDELEALEKTLYEMIGLDAYVRP